MTRKKRDPDREYEEAVKDFKKTFVKTRDFLDFSVD